MNPKINNNASAALVFSAAGRIIDNYNRNAAQSYTELKKVMDKIQLLLSEGQPYLNDRITPINLSVQDKERVTQVRNLIHRLRSHATFGTDAAKVAAQKVIAATTMDEIKMEVFERGYARKGAVIDAIITGLDQESVSPQLEALTDVQAQLESLRTAQKAFKQAQQEKVTALNLVKGKLESYRYALMRTINSALLGYTEVMGSKDDAFIVDLLDTINWVNTEYRASHPKKDSEPKTDPEDQGSDNDSGSSGSDSGSGNNGSNADSESGSDGGNKSDNGGSDNGGSDEGSDVVDK